MSETSSVFSSASAIPSTADAVEADECGVVAVADTHMHLRIAAIFIILVGATGGALFPVLAKRSRWLKVPTSMFNFAKYFGSGVIIATAFIHLLAPGLEALESECLSDAWHEYPYALALCMVSIFGIFVTELLAFRWGSSKLAKLGLHHDAHGHHAGSHAAHGPEGQLTSPEEDAGTLSEKPEGKRSLSIEERTRSPSLDMSLAEEDIEAQKAPRHGHDEKHPHDHHHHGASHEDGQHSSIPQIIGVAILEFGVILHSILIGLTLAVDESFTVLFIVLTFHQTFEGLGIGSRLAYMKLPARYNYIPIVAALVYGLTTPLGLAIGLGVRTSYNPASATASIVSGVLDSVSSGILIYTGLVELLAHEFLFSKDMMSASNGHVLYALGSMFLGCGVMALLGRWA
ncbi:ZIP zinc/iron transport family [Schizophyllum commune H4-8]|uniref:ZIP zinc/iron transport family n=1 Tax=Schizophyllum commune (strain H4-8 / FGSC 9210) TaxID=578458 RepID=UPI0021600A53|nr:ZIP zinc/iron transport family [Schizophyllum commune H4-8]KAI5895244.1 ZIP zinc/iron transport family [Schizophyllum commune H4-8]